MQWLHLRFEAPMASFGGESIDARRIIQDFPAQSMLTGLFANALGWTRGMRAEHERLQSRIVFGAVHEDDPGARRMTDYQTARLAKSDRMWSTRGSPIGRAGGSKTYLGAHQRWRDYHADLRLSVVVTLIPSDEEPSLERIATVLDRPSRPLFVGRKPCLPTARLFQGWLEEAHVLDALAAVAPVGRDCAAFWPHSDGREGARVTMVTDERDWTSGLHGGARRVCMGLVRGRQRLR